MQGSYIDLIIVSNRGFILASKSFAVRGELMDGHAAMLNGIFKVESVIKQYRVDQLMLEDDLIKTCPLVMDKAFPKYV